MTIAESDLVEAHRHCVCHRDELSASEVCGCFYCLAVYPPSEISEWHEEIAGDLSQRPDPWTALCPKCGIDAVIGNESNFPVSDPDFLTAMHGRWFGNIHAAN
ncbi:hypothetical protein [Sphingomonas oryzagri]